MPKSINKYNIQVSFQGLETKIWILKVSVTITGNIIKPTKTELYGDIPPISTASDLSPDTPGAV